MKKQAQVLGTGMISAGMLMAALPAAQAANFYVSPVSAIGKFAGSNSKAFGNATSKEECFSNGSCQQTFENAVVTWNEKNGTKAITGTARAAEYIKAGGAQKLGALESDTWTNSYCGPVVTTFNGSTRSLLVVESGKSQAGNYIDLQSAQGKAWLAERATTKQCFTADENAAVLDATAKNAETAIAAYKATTTDFAVGNATGSAELLGGTFYYQNFENNISALYNAKNGKVEWIATPALGAFNTPRFINSDMPFKSEMREVDGKQVLVTYFSYNGVATSDLGYILYSLDGQHALRDSWERAYEYPDGKIIYDMTGPTLLYGGFPDDVSGRAGASGAVDATYDWSTARYNSYLGMLSLTDAATGKVMTIKAGKDGKPLPGAVPVEDGGIFSLYIEAWGDFARYATLNRGFDWDSIDDNYMDAQTYIGAPVAPAYEDGNQLVQEFEGGTVRWILEEGAKANDRLSIELNSIGLAKQEWYRSVVSTNIYTSSLATSRIGFMATVDAPYELGKSLGDIEMVDGGNYAVQHFENNLTAVVRMSTGHSIWMTTTAFEDFLRYPGHENLNFDDSEVITVDGHQYLVSRFSPQANKASGFALFTSADGKSTLSMDYSKVNNVVTYEGTVRTFAALPSDLMGRSFDANAAVDTSVDWSQAVFNPTQLTLSYYEQATGERFFIKATADGKPEPGATPVKAYALEGYLKASGEPKFPAQDWDFDYDSGAETATDATFLGAPTSSMDTIIDSRQAIVDTYEGGTVTWFVGTTDIKVELNDLGQAKKNWYSQMTSMNLNAA